MPHLRPIRLPSPTDEAMLLLDRCGDNLEHAQTLAALAVEVAPTDLDSLYWFSVYEVLTPSKTWTN